MNKITRAVIVTVLGATLAACNNSSSGASSSSRADATPFDALEVPCAQQADPRLLAMSDSGIQSTSELGLASGRYALPDTTAPTQLVVMFHGHGNDSCSWRNHLRQATAKGAIAVAMDYPFRVLEDGTIYGWFVRQGAADSIAAAKYFLEKYPSVTQVFAFGVSMGGNMSGYAIASPDAKRADGSPLFDWWVDVEGVNNTTEEYLIARAVAQPPVSNSGGALAQQELEEENGGALEDVPEKYQEITNLARVQDMTGLKGVVLVGGLDDGLVPANQNLEMLAALNAVRVPAHLYTVLLNGGAESGTTATAIPLGPVFDQAGMTYESPLAGHGWEGSDTHLVISTGFERLFALMDGATVTPGVTPVPGN